MVYNISLITLRENKRLEWKPSPIKVNKCGYKRKTKVECQNYIRVITLPEPGRLFVCGTNAFDPKCRQYLDISGNYLFEREEAGIARCPYDPSHNNTAIHAGGTLYSATYADYTSRDSLIYSGAIRTEQFNSMWLSEPQFVSSYEYQDKVYFFFRETAVEYKNCGKAIYSRVARICKKDLGGGNRILQMAFTSFLKAQIHCSIPGDLPFYFNEIQATSGMGKGSIGGIEHTSTQDMIYGVFTTPDNSITGSAVCAYRMSDIIRVFRGTFKEQQTADSLWKPVDTRRIPNPHPEQCVNDTTKIMDQTLIFMKTHVLMYDAVPAYGAQPILVQSSNQSRYTSVAIDWQVRAVNGKYYDMLFVGTDNGRVVKAFNKAIGDKIETVVIEEIQVFHESAPVLKVEIYRNLFRGEEKLIVVSADEIKSVPLHRCHLRKYSCRACVGLQDPYCAWDDSNCINSNHGLQSLESGHHELCPDNNAITDVLTDENNNIFSSTTTRGPCEECRPCSCEKPDKDTEAIDNKIDTFPAGGRLDFSKEAPKHFTLTTFAISVTLAAVVSLVTGILVGYCASRCSCDCCSHQRRDNVYQEKPSSGKPERDLDRELPRMNHYETYMAPTQQKQLNVVLNVKKPSEKSLNELDTSTLNKTRKVYV
ncbi:semaphorin-1A-like isoform X2 [Tubulanus polymorphus]